MNQVFFREQALRARNLAEMADPFIRKRLLALAEKYDVKAGEESKAPRLTEPSLELSKTSAARSFGRSGEA